MPIRAEKQDELLGIVIPCHNEEEVFPLLIDALRAFMDSLSHRSCVLLVDDGSYDRTYELMQEACREDERFAAIKLSRNFGHQAAVSAGLEHIRGDAVAVMDADLQDPPAVVSSMLEKWREGFDVVYGIRRNRKENVLLRAAYKTFYRLLERVSHIHMPVDAGDFCLMDRRVVEILKRMPEQNRFVRGLRGWLGLKQTGVPYDRDARRSGEPKYDMRRLFKLALDGIVSFSTVPLRLATWLGVAGVLLGMIYLAYTVVVKYTDPAAPLGWASVISVVTFFGSVQLLVIGLMGEYIARIYDEVKQRPIYIAEDRSGWIQEKPSEA